MAVGLSQPVDNSTGCLLQSHAVNGRTPIVYPLQVAAFNPGIYGGCVKTFMPQKLLQVQYTRSIADQHSCTSVREPVRMDTRYPGTLPNSFGEGSSWLPSSKGKGRRLPLPL